MIHDYKLLENIYSKIDSELIQISDRDEILYILNTTFDRGKGGAIGYTGFVFLCAGLDVLKYCTMEDFYSATKEIELNYSFIFRRFDKDYDFDTKSTNRADAWQQLKEIAGGNCRFNCIESGYIFYPELMFDNDDVNGKGMIKCSKYSNPFLHFEMIPFPSKRIITVNRSIGKIVNSFIQTEFYHGLNTYKSDIWNFILSEYGSPRIQLADNHYFFFLEELKRTV